jgi:hypothetical protein
VRDHWPSQQELQERLDYDRVSGLFTWKNIRTNRFRGKVAGHQGHQGHRGYVSLYWNGRKLQAHQVAWCYVNGVYPVDLIDHKDGDPSNNAFDNLREASSGQNAQNKRTQGNNRSGFKGVSFHKSHSGKKWRAAITVNKTTISLGHFATEDQKRDVPARTSPMIYLEAKGNGLNPKALRVIVRKQRADAKKAAELRLMSMPTWPRWVWCEPWRASARSNRTSGPIRRCSASSR